MGSLSTSRSGGAGGNSVGDIQSDLYDIVWRRENQEEAWEKVHSLLEGAYDAGVGWATWEVRGYRDKNPFPDFHEWMGSSNE